MASDSVSTQFLATGLLRWLGRIGAPLFYHNPSWRFLPTTVNGGGRRGLVQRYLGLSVNATFIEIYQRNCLYLVAGLMFVSFRRNRQMCTWLQHRLLKVMCGDGRRNYWRDGRIIHCDKIRHYFPQQHQIDWHWPWTGHTQYLGAGIIAAAFVLKSFSRFWEWLSSGLIAIFGWWISRLAMSFGFDRNRGVASRRR